MRYLTRDALKRLRIEPELAVWAVEIGIADNVGTDRTVRQAQVTGALRDREWETRSDCRECHSSAIHR